jgi:hypothetical protein
MNSLFKLSTVIVALAILVALVAGSSSAAPVSDTAPTVEITVERGSHRGIVKRRVATSVASSGVQAVDDVQRVKLHPFYVEITIYGYGGAYPTLLVIPREDFIELTGPAI